MRHSKKGYGVGMASSRGFWVESDF